MAAASSRNSSHMTSLVDLISCQKCKQIPDKHVTFNCLHSFCEQCVKSLPVVEGENGQGMNCFECNTFSSLQDVGRDGQLIKNLLQLYQIQELKQVEGRMCVCQKSHGQWRCIDCDLDLCDPCQQGHLLLPPCRNHTVAKMSDPKYLEVIKSNPKLSCTVHNDREVEFNCKQCRQLICASCQVLYHMGHDLTDINKGLDAIAPEVEEYLDQITSRKSHQEDVDGKLDEEMTKLQTNDDTIKEAIEQKYNTKMAEIQSERELLITQAEMETKTRMAAIRKDIEKVNHTRARLEHALTWSTSIRNNTAGAGLLQELYTHVPRLRGVLQDTDSPDPVIDSTYPVFEAMGRKEEQSMIGHIVIKDSKPKKKQPKQQPQPKQGSGPKQQPKPEPLSEVNSSFRCSPILFDDLAKRKIIDSGTLRINNECERLCLINTEFWLPATAENQIMIYTKSGLQHNVITLNKMSRPRAVHSLTDDTVLVACENGLLVLLTSDHTTDDSNGHRLLTGDYCDVNVTDETIYALKYDCNAVDVLKPDDRGQWGFVTTIDLMVPFLSNVYDRILVAGSEMFIGSSLTGDVTVYTTSGERSHTLVGPESGNLHLLVSVDSKKQLLLLNKDNMEFSVTNTENHRPFLLDQFKMADVLDACVTSSDIVFVLTGNETENCEIHKIELKNSGK